MLASVRHQIGFLLGKMSGMGFEVQSDANLQILTTEILKSNAIEGEKLNWDEVRSSLARKLGIDIAGLAQPNRHIDGVVEMMLDATQNYRTPLTQERLFGWHNALFPVGRSGLRTITVASWRTKQSGEMQVVSGPFGREQVHFVAPNAERISLEMKRFFEFFNSENVIDPVLKAAIAHFWFVTIHPFEDGNGRIARAIAELCLARADGMSNRFYSMSDSIERNRKMYYDILEKTQKGELDITQWLLWFLHCLEDSIAHAATLLEKVLYKARIWNIANHYPINDRQRHVLNLLLSDFHGHLTTSKYSKIAKCSQDTALRDINALMEYGVLLQSESSGRSRHYILPQ
jgi:Fic family protein